MQGWLLEVFVVAIMVNSMRWCCSALSFPFICLGSNSASMCSDMLCCYIPGVFGFLVVFFFLFMRAFVPETAVGLVAGVFLVAEVCLLWWPIRDSFSGKVAPQGTTADMCQSTGRKALPACPLSTNLPGGMYPCT